MGIESQQGSYQHSSTATGAANRGAMKNAGYGGVKFRGTKPQQYGPQTVAEVAASRSGIAPTAKNMGSLAVQYRADEATALKAGELTDRNKRDQKIIDARGVGGGTSSGIVPTDSKASHSQRTAPILSAGGIGTLNAPRSPKPGARSNTPRVPVRSNSKYGLF